ncbi:hypothetical protein QWJ34_19970 [Saccharibacillus sp. CPCC 101409]|uniref:hypothetical protein n=1 Tax=Saccharibacillus sp. CPCC 101409 TaxID=3058041 RepID=UPI0026723915|nr:hypothetical protein [Saccharibacillus sp. CPCC 101409]MDO3412050.1 hypothetical protein [Saccharibacillus sp. CPCC 101409]
MQRLREEKGSALVMVMFMMLILTLLGVAVLSATVGGARRTLTRENDIQSLQLTQKVLDESVAYISSKIDLAAAASGVTSDTLKPLIDGIVAGIPLKSADNDNAQTENLYEAKGRLLEKPGVADVFKDLPVGDPRKGTAYIITLKAAGEVNGVKRTLTQEMRVNMYPDFLQYAFGSEQNLILNGAPYIVGNIYAGDKLVVTNHPQYIYEGKSLATNSVFPKMTTDGQVYIQSLDGFVSSENGAPLSPVTSGGDSAVGSRVQQALGVGVSQIHIKDRQKFVQINVESSFLDKLAAAVNLTGVTQASLQKAYAGQSGSASNRMAAVVQSLGSTSVFQAQMPEKPVLDTLPILSADPTDKELSDYNAVVKSNQDKVEKYNNAINKLKTALASLNKTTVFQGDLLIDGKTFDSIGTSDKNNWLIVNGNLTLAGGSQPVSLASNVLVTGNVRFKDSAAVDSTMLTMGSTTIEDAVITGIAGKEIVLISKGEVLLNRVDAFSSAATSVLRGFFYTDSTATLYGVGSNFALEGGFFAKGDLTVNAVVGESKRGTGDIVFAPQSSALQDSTSRFKVHYNDEVYSHQGSWLPQVQQVSISVGQLKME